MRTVAVIQSNYLPWKGYFDIIHDVDRFIFYDDVQFTKNDWRNRNLVKTQSGTAWITVPVGRDLHRLIRDVTLPDRSWAAKHWKTLGQYYSRAPHFGAFREFFEHVYLERAWDRLSELNQFLVTSIARDFLGIRTEFRDSFEYGAAGQRAERLLDLLKKAGAGAYVSGPAARDYIDEAAFAREGIRLAWKSYAGYPEYPQAHPPFTHQVSIVDLLFNVGRDAPWYIWGWREETRSRAEET
jgi:hypothetical protein